MNTAYSTILTTTLQTFVAFWLIESNICMNSTKMAQDSVPCVRGNITSCLFEAVSFFVSASTHLPKWNLYVYTYIRMYIYSQCPSQHIMMPNALCYKFTCACKQNEGALNNCFFMEHLTK